MEYHNINRGEHRMDLSKKRVENNRKTKTKSFDDEVKIKYDIIMPEERDRQPKDYDEIEY